MKPLVLSSTALLALLVLVAYFKLTVIRQDPVRLEARAKIQLLLAALDAYQLDVGTYPTTKEGLRALRVRPPNVKDWEGPYLRREIPVDPWGRPFVYRNPGQREGRAPDVVPLGSDDKPIGEGPEANILE